MNNCTSTCLKCTNCPVMKIVDETVTANYYLRGNAFDKVFPKESKYKTKITDIYISKN